MSAQPVIKRKPLWLYFIGGTVLLVVLAFLFIANGIFVRSVVLPKVAAQLKSDLTTDDVSFSPFSSITLRGVKLVPKGDETLFTAKEVRIRYSLFAILGGKITVDEILLDTPQITLVQRSATDGNLAKILPEPSSAPAESKSAKSEVPQIDIRNVNIKDALFRLTDRGAVTEVSGFNLSLDQLKNGGSGKLTLSGVVKRLQGADQVVGGFKSSFDISLTPQLLPAGVKGGLEFSADQAAGAFKDFAKLGATLQTDMSPTEIRQLQLSFKKDGQSFGSLGLNGTLALEKKEARLNYEIQGLDRRVLGIVGAGAGLDVGQTQVSAKGNIDMTKDGQIVSSKGRLAVDRFSLGLTNGVTPVLDIGVDYQATADLSQQTALIQKLDLGVKQAAKSLITGTLDRPMNLAWGKVNPGYGESTFSLAIANFNLEDWKVFLGAAGPSGVVSTDLKVQAESDGRLLKFSLGTAVDNLSLLVGSNRVDRARVQVSAKGSVEGFNDIKVDNYAVAIDRLGQSILKIEGTVNYDLQKHDVGAQTSGELDLPLAMQSFPVPDLTASTGKLKFTVQYNQKSQATNASAAINLGGFSGRMGTIEFKDYSANLQVAVDLKQGVLVVNRATVSAQTGFTPGGSLDVDGKYDLARKSGKFTLKTVALSQSALGPFVAAALLPNELKSVSLDLNGQATMEESGAASLAMDLTVSKLIVNDPTGRIPNSPLGAGVGLDVAVKGQVIDLKKFQLSLEPTARASNKLLVSGHVDMTPTNATPSMVTVRSEGLDLTTFYDLFAGKPSSKTESASTPGKVTPAGDPTVEPAAVVLPFKRFDADIDIARIYLRDVAVTNLVAKAKIDNGSLQLNPFSLNLNGAPITAVIAANLGVPGYQYDVQFDAKGIPIAPFARSFATGEKLVVNGAISAKTALKGAGVTGNSLRRNLNGTVEFGAAGMDYRIELSKNRFVKNILLPVLSGVLKMPNLGQSPIETVSAKANAENGNVNIVELKVLSPAFVVEGGGRVQLADILTNSPVEVPVRLALVKDGKPDFLPDFLTVVGTVGAPKPKYDMIGVARVATRLPGGVGQLIGGTLGSATNTVNKLTGGVLGNLLGGKATNVVQDAISTNKPATQALPNAVDALRGLFPGNKKKP